MNTKEPVLPENRVSRRSFIAAAGYTAAAVCLTSRRVFAEDAGPVTVIRTAAASARISITKLRGNVSVLEGSGGNI
ncbi:MAG TPA: MBL fold metallo-hydrolase, partial [Verrucomicrobiae bacterium]|nr:MBL fold metallo-hydrolase [Verrucomicrobiae bacterium]